MQSIALLSITADDFKAIVREAVSQVLAEKSSVKETTPPQADELLTREQTAEMLHVSLLTLRNYSRKGLLHPKQIGRRVLYTRADVVAALNTRRYGVRGQGH